MENSAYRAAFKAARERLKRKGVFVGESSGYPRVEIHSVGEGERLDKGGCLRKISLNVESMSSDSLGEAEKMNSDNLSLLTSEDLATESSGFKFVGIVPSQLQDSVEESDTQNAIYRIIQGFDIYLETI